MEVTVINKFRKTTDVQRTWREYGWTPPSEQEAYKRKWHFFRKLDTDQQPQYSQENSNV